MDAPKPTKIIFSSITQGRDQSSIGNAVSAVKSQIALLQKPVHLEFRFDATLGDALDYFYHTQDADVLVAVNNLMMYPEAWVVDNALGHKDKPVIIGVYPVPGIIDWERIRARAADTREPNKAKGHVYNIALETAEYNTDTKFAKVPSAKLDCVIIKRKAIRDIVKQHPEVVHSQGILVHTETIGPDRAKLTADETFCRLYGKPIYADLENPISSFGNQIFAGVCGLRRHLR